MDTEKATSTAVMTQSQPKYRIFIENGVMYHVFFKEFSPDVAVEVQENALVMLREKKLETIPVIVDLRDVTETTFKLKMKDYTKVVTSRDFIKHASSVWIVGAKGKVKSIGGLVNTVFFGGRMHIVDTIEEAQKGALAGLSDTRPILEQ